MPLTTMAGMELIVVFVMLINSVYDMLLGMVMYILLCVYFDMVLYIMLDAVYGYFVDCYVVCFVGYRVCYHHHPGQQRTPH